MADQHALSIVNRCLREPPTGLEKAAARDQGDAKLETRHPDPEPVRDWIFDLDNTLYPATCDLFSQVNQRIQDYIGDFLGLPPTEARALQRRYLREHGASMHGLMVNHDMDPRAFLAYVHDIDFSPVPPWPALDRALARLPGRKLAPTITGV